MTSNHNGIHWPTGSLTGDTNNPIIQSLSIENNLVLVSPLDLDIYIPGGAPVLIATSEQFTGFLLLITELLIHGDVVGVETLVLHHGDPAPARHRAGGERDLGPGV